MGETSRSVADLASLTPTDRRWFRAVADYTNDWESWHAPDGRLVWVNLAVERITGFCVSECMSMENYPLPMVAAEDRDQVAEVLVAARNRTSGENVEFRSVHRDGRPRWMSLSWQPMYGEQDAPMSGDFKPDVVSTTRPRTSATEPPVIYLGFRTSVRDVTELHELREQLRLHAEHLEQLVQERSARLRQLEDRQRQMEKLAALGQLAAGVAHEINNPLAGMRNAFELIRSGLSPEHEHYDLLELIDREIERISGITHQMYQLYRRSTQEPSEFAIDQIVGEVAYLLENVAEKRGVKLASKPPSSSVNVLLPEGEVKQVLYNILRNAIQASPPGEDVAVEISSADREVSVHVVDRGQGIQPEILSRIFDPFFSTKHGDTQSGMGLGLSVSRSLIEAMGGRIEVTSEPGRGSRFTAVFPRHRESPEELNDA
jgi:PAS domain S-box-containing protein